MFSLRDIAQPVEPASASDKGEAIYARFEANPDCLLIPVLDDYQRPLGLIERNRFLTRLAGQYGRAVFGSRSVELVMSADPLVVEADVAPGDFAAMALESSTQRLLQGFIVTDRGRYVGVGAILDLLRAAASERVETARTLTDLVGDLKASALEVERQRRLAETVVEHIPTILAVCSGETGRMIMVNRAAEAVLGLPREMAVGRRCLEIEPQGLGEQINRLHEELESQPTKTRLDLEFRPEGGQPPRQLRLMRIPLTMPDGERLNVTVGEDVTEEMAARARIEELAHFDSLTRLPNRARFHEWLNEAVAAADHSARIARPLAAAAQGALLAIDIDRFKSVNDTLGHSAGDALLCEVADRLRAVCAELATGDLADGDVDVLPGRLGGDEFAVVLRGHDVAQAAVRLAGRLVDKLAEPYAIGRQAVHLGASIGLAVCPQDAASAEELMRHADIALYSAKADGKGVWRRFCQSMQSALQNRHDMERDLRRALENGEIGVHYQPQFSLAEQRVTGFEALMRWRHPERGLVPPASFIPVAEDLGLIVPLGEWILREACRQAARLPEDISMAVNISAVQLDHPGFVAAVVQALASAGLPARRLEIEVTESVLMEDKAQVQASIRRLRELGVRLALDDFGTGYASLSYLQRFPFDKIKIDRTFTRGLPDNPAASAIVAAVTALAGQLGMSTTAEGVEDEEQLAAITRLGCTEAQGYLIGMPGAISDSRLDRPGDMAIAV